MKWIIRDLIQAPINGFWLLIADVLWGFSFEHREGYYAYKENCWRNVEQAQTFHSWIREGGWKIK